MKKLIITLLSVLAIAFTFTGCGDSAGSISSSIESTTEAINGTDTSGVVIDNGDTTSTTITNEFGLNPSLGTPPPLPAS